MELQEQIKKAIEKALDSLGVSGIEVKLEHPTDAAHGDYATNVAMVAAVKAGESPMEQALEIASKINKGDLISKIEVAKPGFINFWLSQDILLQELQKSLTPFKGDTGNGMKKGKKITIEYTDPNPLKEFHIGHLFSNTVGEALSRLFEAQGGNVRRANYQGDVGIHVAKAIWGLAKKLQEEDITLEKLEKKPLSERTAFLGKAYAAGSTAFEEDEKTKEEIKQLNKKIYEQSSEQINNLYQTGKKWSLEAFEKIYQRLGTKFDFYYFESETGKVGAELVQKHPETFKKDQGAIIFEGEKHGLHNRVFINSMGLPTYEAKDLGLAHIKYQDYPYDESYIITANEVDEYFRVLLTALKTVNPELGEKTTHLSHGIVRLPTGKMSSRTGTILTGEWLLDEAKARLQKEYKMPDSRADKVAVAGIKYALLKSAIGKDIIFDFDTSLSFEGDSGPYLQYTFARTQSVLSKATTDYRLQTAAKQKKTVEINPEELALFRHMYRFPEVVAEAAQNYAPNLMCTFLHELAQNYNTFYNKHKIVGVEKEEFRLTLTAATGNILKKGLWLLGIQAPERM